jgi:putative ABC transport system substrate-binding protein
MVLKILNGAKPGDMPVEGVAKSELYVNLAAAKAQGVTLPADLINEAKEVIR